MRTVVGYLTIFERQREEEAKVFTINFSLTHDIFSLKYRSFPSPELIERMVLPLKSFASSLTHAETQKSLLSWISLSALLKAVSFATRFWACLVKRKARLLLFCPCVEVTPCGRDSGYLSSSPTSLNISISFTTSVNKGELLENENLSWIASTPTRCLSCWGGQDIIQCKWYILALYFQLTVISWNDIFFNYKTTG